MDNYFSSDHTYGTVQAMCNTLIGEAFKKGLTETNQILLPVLAWMSVYGGGGESMRRPIIVSFLQPRVFEEPALWLNAASRKLFKHVPGDTWRLVFERNQLVDDATAIQPSKPMSEIFGQPVETEAELKALDAPHTSVVLLAELGLLYKRDKNLAIIEGLDVASDFGGGWKYLPISEYRNAFVQGD